MHFKITLVTLPTKRKYLSSQNFKHPILNCTLYTLPLLVGYSSLESLHYSGQFNLFKIIFLYVTQSLHTSRTKGGTSKRRDPKFKASIYPSVAITTPILLHEKFLQFDWLRLVVFQLNLKYLHVKITNLSPVVV